MVVIRVNLLKSARQPRAQFILVTASQALKKNIFLLILHRDWNRAAQSFFFLKSSTLDTKVFKYTCEQFCFSIQHTLVFVCLFVSPHHPRHCLNHVALAWNLLCKPGWMDLNSEGSPCLCLNAGINSVGHHCQALPLEV